jgi:hypothetical protein
MTIDYRKASPEIRAAWLAYKALLRFGTPSVTSFVAGYNAALAANKGDEHDGTTKRDGSCETSQCHD